MSGFSLGANVVTTFLEDLGDAAAGRGVVGAATNAMPFDVPNCYENLNDDGFTKSVYGDRLLQSIIAHVKDSYNYVNYGFPIERAYECRTITDMENLIIAPVFWFEDVFDEYEKTSTIAKLNRIAVPHYII